MRRATICVLLLAVVYSWIVSCLSSSAITNTSLQNFNLLNSLLPPTPKLETAIVADLDGEVYLVDASSRKILWSFSSGGPIYSSYQAFLNHDNEESDDSESNDDFYIDCGEDWALYAHSKSFGTTKLKVSAEEYIRNAPYVSADGGVTLGSKKTTVFLVDAKSGKLVRTFKLDGSPSTTGVQGARKNPILLDEEASDALNLERVEQPLYIKRIDYVLQHYSPDGKVLWNVAFAEFDAAFQYPKIESTFGGIHYNSSHELSKEYKSDVNSQLLYQSGPIMVLRIRDKLTESLSTFDRLIKGYSGGRPLPLPAPSDDSSSGVTVQVPLALPNIEGRQVLSLPASKNKTYDALVVSDRVASGIKLLSIFAVIIAEFNVAYRISILLGLLLIMGFAFYGIAMLLKRNKREEELKYKSRTPKKKRTRRLGHNKGNSNYQEIQEDNAHEDEVGQTKGIPLVEGRELKMPLIFSDVVDTHVDGRRIGKLVVLNTEIAKGSNGTVVLEGIYDGRPTAVKRLVRAHHDVAVKEIQNLIASDHHPNIVRWYGVEKDQDFVYLALERCTCSLNDLIFVCSKSFRGQIIMKDQDSNFRNEYIAQLQLITENTKDVELWTKNGCPTLQLLKLMRDVVCGLAHLHELGIIHRDLKPQNVLITKDRAFCAKLSDMGISKRLKGDKQSLTQHATGCGSSGWRAPEQLLLQGRQTRAVDLFSLGCVLFFCLTGGKHPYGDSIERDVNIVNSQKDLFLVENIPEAVDLLSRLLDPNPNMRPKAMDVCHHPLFWDSETRLSFLRDVSDRVELEDRESKSELLSALESIAAVALNGKWDEKMETAFMNDIGRYRRYKFDSIRDLLRVIRNKLNHYRELSQEVQEILGPVPEGFDGYFSRRFPRLLIEVYNVIYRHCKEEDFFDKYIN